MPDLQLIITPGSAAAELPRFDLSIDGPDLATDAGLYTACVVSLFTDRRAEADDALPDGGDDRRGWWGDAFSPAEGDKIGSRLWLLAREKQLPEVLRRAREYATEALQWLIDDGIARQVDVAAENPRQGVLALTIRILRPDGSTAEVKFDNVWETLHAV